MGDYGAALERYQRALAGEEKTLGKDHPETLTTVQKAAIAFQIMGEYDKALGLCKRALDGREALGKDHPLTLTTVHVLATLFCNKGEYDKALEWFLKL